MSNRNTHKILISLIVGVAVSCVALNMFSKLQNEIKERDDLIKVMEMHQNQLKVTKYSYLVAKRDMLAGETIKFDDIAFVKFDKEEKDAFSSLDMVLNNVLLKPVKQGQLMTSYLFTHVKGKGYADANGLREGYRALTLGTSSLDGLSKTMKTGSIIDVFSKSKSSPLVLSKVKILDMEPINEKDTNIDITKAKNVTLEVQADKIQKLVDIYSSGKLLFVMRPIMDNSVIKEDKPTEKKVNTQQQNKKGDSEPPAINSLPTLPSPIIQTYEDATINELPAPVSTQKKSTNYVELIEASNKTKVSFD